MLDDTSTRRPHGARYHRVAALLATGCIGACHSSDLAPPPIDPSLPGLSGFAGNQLETRHESVRRQLRKRCVELGIREASTDEWFEYMPFRVAPFDSHGIAWVLLSAYPGYMIPDVSAVRIHGFSENWSLQRTELFTTGYRYFLNSIDVVTGNALNEPLVVVTTTCVLPMQVDIDRLPDEEYEEQLRLLRLNKHYFALRPTGFLLVRYESHDGSVAQCSYRNRLPQSGPPVPTRTPEAWLRTSDLATQDQSALKELLSGAPILYGGRRL